MPRFRPDIKPPCWGSFDAVSYAVRVNAEKLGIDPAKLALCMPLWERGGLAPLEYVAGVRGVMTTATWADDGIFASAGNFYVASPLLNKATPAVTFLALMRKVTVVNSIIVFSNRTAWSSAHGHEIGISSAKFTFSFGDGAAYESKSGVIDYRFIDNPKNDARLYGYTYDAGALRLYADFYPGKRAHDVLTTTRTSIASAGTNAMKMCAGTGVSASVGMLFGALAAIPHAAVERLATEPYALIMPVSRPLYFDLGASAGTDALTANDLVVGSLVLGTPALGQAHALTASGITVDGPVLGAPALAQIYALTAQNFTASSPVLGAPAVGQAHALTATWLTVSGPVLGTPSLTENDNPVDALTADSLVVGSPVLGTPSLGQVHVLGSDGLVTGSPVLGLPIVRQIHTITAFGLTVGAPTIGTPELNKTTIDLDITANLSSVGLDVMYLDSIGTFTAQLTSSGCKLVTLRSVGNFEVAEREE